jgi:ribonucleoside-diphosphate reductase alpha chain
MTHQDENIPCDDCGNPVGKANYVTDGKTICIGCHVKRNPPQGTSTFDSAPKRETPKRYRLPPERSGVTHKFEIRTAEQRYKGYVTIGFYEDGAPGEIFFKMDQQGSEISGLLDAWSIAVSMLLQQGTPLSVIIDKYKGTQFEPSGMTGDSACPFARSPLDYVARWLERRFGDGNET